MKKVWGIQGSDYDGCNGWHTWICKELYFQTKEKAQDYINYRWVTGHYEPVIIGVIED